MAAAGGWWWLTAAAALWLVAWIRAHPYRAKFAIYYTLVSIVAVFCVPLFALFDPCDPINTYRSSKVLRLISHVLGVEWEVRGGEALSSRRACVVVANHQTSVDVLGMFWLSEWMRRCSAVAKREIFWAWPFGLALWLSGTIFIDRLHTVKAKKQLEVAVRDMHEKGNKLWFFPEGTRNPGRSLMPFKKGAFHVAVECQAPIVPVVFSPYYFINHHNEFFGPGRVVVTALPPVETKGLTLEDVEELQKRVRDQMLAVYKKVAKELRAELPDDYPGLVGFE